MKLLCLIFFVIFSLQLYAQNERVLISGEVKNDSSSIENVHIINLNSNVGTLSNAFGMYKIAVKLNDSLLISSIQYESQLLIIKKEQLQNRTISIDLEIKINELDEIILKEHNLSGNLIIDSKLLKDSISAGKKMKDQIMLMDLDKPVVLDNDAIENEKPPDASKLTNPNIPVGGDLIKLFRPLLKEVSKIGQTKRELKNKKRIYNLNASKAPESIREELGDLFFTDRLNIQIEQIGDFILYCKPKGIVELYMKNNKLQMIALLIDESKIFMTKDQNQHPTKN